MAKDILTFGDAEYYSCRADMQRVYYKDVEVGALIIYRNTHKEYFNSMELRYKTCDEVQDEYKVTKDKLSIEPADTNGYYELWLELVDDKKYCDLMSLAAKIYKRLRPIVCKQCGKTLFYTDAETDGAAGAFEAQQYGVIYKMPFLYNPKVTSAFFCNKTCNNRWFAKNADKRAQDEANAFLAKCKEEMPKAIAGAMRGAATLYSMLLEMKQSVDGGKRLAEIVNDEKKREEFVKKFIAKNKQTKLPL